MKTTLIEIQPKEELFKLISKSVENAIESKTISDSAQEELLTTKQVCELLNFSRVTIWSLTKKNVITSYRIGSQLRYKRSEIMQSLIKINHK